MNTQEKAMYNKAVKDCSMIVGYLSLKSSISGAKNEKVFRQIQKALLGLKIR